MYSPQRLYFALLLQNSAMTLVYLDLSKNQGRAINFKALSERSVHIRPTKWVFVWQWKCHQKTISAPTVSGQSQSNGRKYCKFWKVSNSFWIRNSNIKPLNTWIIFSSFFEIQPEIGYHRLPTHRSGAHRKFFRWSLLNLKSKFCPYVPYLAR